MLWPAVALQWPLFLPGLHDRHWDFPCLFKHHDGLLNVLDRLALRLAPYREGERKQVSVQKHLAATFVPRRQKFLETLEVKGKVHTCATWNIDKSPRSCFLVSHEL